jgi:hypothetical protein
VQLDASGQASITSADVDGGSSDACGIASLSLSQDSFACSDVGDNTVGLTATDVNGNTASCDATVTVIDDEVRWRDWQNVVGLHGYTNRIWLASVLHLLII